jgi:hypothetical protein
VVVLNKNPGYIAYLANGQTMKNLEWEIQAYGSPKDDILESVQDSLTFKLSGPGMVVASYLSDAQELIASNQSGTNEIARQYINIAKMIMMEFELGFNPR